MSGKIAFQGELGAYGHQACVEARPSFSPLPCPTFAATIKAVRDGDADLGMIAVENSTYGRVADVHSLLPESGLHIVDEAFVRVHINLLGPKGATLSQITDAHGHVVILPQCAGFLTEKAIRGVVSSDNAKAARDVAEGNDPTQGALASELAADIYGLDVLASHIEDQDNNTTRFIVMSRDLDTNKRGDHGMMTSLVFRVRNIPASLFKAMGGFATNGVNMTKLESYQKGTSFSASMFYADIVGAPGDPALDRAMEELAFHSKEVRILGTYPSARARG